MLFRRGVKARADMPLPTVSRGLKVPTLPGGGVTFVATVNDAAAFGAITEMASGELGSFATAPWERALLAVRADKKKRAVLEGKPADLVLAHFEGKRGTKEQRRRALRNLAERAQVTDASRPSSRRRGPRGEACAWRIA